MINILVSTIVRDCESSIENYYSLLKSLTSQNDLNFFLSLYENDSHDKTKEIIENLDWSFIKNKISFDTIGTNKFGSIVSEERVKNLANARNKTIDQADEFLKQADFVLSLEPDVSYKIEDVWDLIRHETKFGFKCDLLTPIVGCSKSSGTQIDENLKFYDTWAFRKNPSERFGDLFSNFKEDPIQIVWSTYSCVALYNAEIFRKGIRFSGYNARTKSFDCDTAVICEIMHENGYNKILVDQSKVVVHP